MASFSQFFVSTHLRCISLLCKLVIKRKLFVRGFSTFTIKAKCLCRPFYWLNDYERGLSVINVLSLKTRHFPQNVLLLIPISLIIIQIFEKLGVRLPTLFERDRKCTKKYWEKNQIKTHRNSMQYPVFIYHPSILWMWLAVFVNYVQLCNLTCFEC